MTTQTRSARRMAALGRPAAGGKVVGPRLAVLKLPGVGVGGGAPEAGRKDKKRIATRLAKQTGLNVKAIRALLKRS